MYKNLLFFVKGLSLCVLLAISNISFGQTVINLADQCNCEVKKPGIVVNPGDTISAATNQGDLLVDINGSIYYWNGSSWQTAKLFGNDTDSTNEFQVLSISNDTLYLSNGNIVITGIPFRPTAIEFMAFSNIDNTTLNTVGSDLNNIDNYYGSSMGYVLNNNGSITQQCKALGSNAKNSSNQGNLSRYASSAYCIGMRYCTINGTYLGITNAKISTINANGFTLTVDNRADNLLVMYTAYR